MCKLYWTLCGFESTIPDMTPSTDPGSNAPHVVIIGAGIGGLATAARLAGADLRVTVLERHSHPGGKMRTWTSTGTGWTQTSHLSEGWDAFSKIAVPGTANGGSQDDVVAVPESGTGRLYRGRAGGGITSTYSTISEYLGSLVIIG